MNIEKQRAKWRAYYHKNGEKYRQSARERARVQRATHQETPEEAEARRAYHNNYYRTKLSPKYANERKAKREQDLAAIIPVSESSKFQLKMIVIGLLAHRHKERLARRREWKQKRYGYSPRKPAKLKPIKTPKLPLTPEEVAIKKQLALARRRQYRNQPEVLARINAKKREQSKLALLEAANDPVKLEALRDKRRTAGRRWIERMKAERPEDYKAYVKRQTAKELNRRAIDPQRKLATILRTKVYVAVRRQQRGLKTSDTLTLLGCSVAQFMAHIESLWKPGMTWENFGKGRDKWVLDHIRPVASWDLTKPENQAAAFHFSNVQPLWFLENCRKSSHHEGRKWLHSDHALLPPPFVAQSANATILCNGLPKSCRTPPYG